MTLKRKWPLILSSHTINSLLKFTILALSQVRKKRNLDGGLDRERVAGERKNTRFVISSLYFGFTVPFSK